MADQCASGKRRAVVADDDNFARALVSETVAALGYEVVDCDSGSAALAACREADPDIAVLDLDLGPGPNGAEVLQLAREEMPWIAGVILTGHRSIRMVSSEATIDEPNTVLLVKADVTTSQVLAEAIDSAIADEPFVAAPTTSTVLLSETQAHLLRMIAQGLSNEEIASQRGTSVRAVENLVSRLYQVLNLPRDGKVSQRVQATKMYHDGLVSVA